MDKHAFLYMGIEAVVFILPIATLFVKYGKAEQKQNDKLSKHDEAIKELQEEGKTTSQLLASINAAIASISTKMDLLIDGKIKSE